MHLSWPLCLQRLFTQHLLYWWTDHSNNLLFRVVTAPMPLASGWPLCSSWRTPRPTSLAWTSCTMLPRWGGALGWTDAHRRKYLWKNLLSCYFPQRLCDWFIPLLHLYCSASFIFHPQQAEDIDTELLTFPSQLEHIGMASRWLSLVHWQSSW